MTHDPEPTSRKETIWHIVSQIPKGKVATYGQVAELAGITRGARLVGRILNQLPKDSQLPWHRVVNAAGKVSLRSQTDGHNQQQHKLNNEDVVFISGKLNLSLYRWQP